MTRREAFEAIITLKPRKKVGCNSAEKLLQKLGELRENEVEAVWLNLMMDAEWKIECLAEFRKVRKSGKAQIFFKHFEIGVDHGEDYDKDTAVELKKELNDCIKTGIRFKELSLIYLNQAMMTEEEAEVLVDGIGAKHRGALPPLVFSISSSVGVNLLQQCLKIEWPVESILVESDDFKNADIDWEELQRLCKSSKFSIRLFNEGDDTGLDVSPMLQAVLCGIGTVTIHQFSESVNWLEDILDPHLERW